MSWLMLVPAIDPARTAEFLTRLRLPVGRVLIVDNAARPLFGGRWHGRYHRPSSNLGVAGSWNVGARAVLDENADWLVLASTSVRLGPPGGQDFVAALDECDNIGLQCHLGWHLIAVHRRAFETVGLFDDGFWPAYCEEVDFLYRLALAGLPSPRENGRAWCYVDVDGEFGDQAACITDGTISAGVPYLSEQRYAAKWGGTPGSERWSTPWNGGSPS